jgi:hypothetical protein
MDAIINMVSDIDNTPLDVVNNLVIQKPRIFDQLARDALSILGIQMVFFPLFLAMVGFISGIYNINI